MAIYKTRIDEKSGITFVEVTGTMVLEEHLPYMNSESYGNRTSRLIADVREASLAGMSRGTLAKMLRTVKPLGRPGIRAAYVCSKGEDFSKAKLMLAQIEALAYEGQFQIFTDMTKALEWVQKDIE